MRTFLAVLTLIIGSTFGFSEVYAEIVRPKQPSYLCQFGLAWVPCIRLAHPGEVFGSKMRYRPIKWIPLWPNNSVFGGNPPEDFTRSVSEIVSQRFDPNVKTIEELPIAPAIDKQFVDLDISDISEWADQQGMGDVLQLIESKKAYHGDEIFELWKKSTLAGIICKDSVAEYYDSDTKTYLPKDERYCAFSRARSTRSSKVIDYCTLEEDIPSRIRFSPTCTVVASERKDIRQILATRYTQWNLRGGEYAGEFQCNVPNASRDEVLPKVENFIKEVIGKSSKYVARADHQNIDYLAEGINIEDTVEKMFLRVFLSGSYSDLASWNRGKEKGVKFSLRLFYTVSAQSSDDITDYREPSRAMSHRIRNRFEESLRKALRQNWSKAICKLDIE